MRNWCALLVMGAVSALLTMPLEARQWNNGAGEEASPAGTAAESSAAARTAAPAKNVFALPATPRPKPFPAPAAAATDTRPLGSLVPRYEIAGTYDYLNFMPGDPFANFNSHGGAGSFTYNASKWVGVTAEVGGYHFNRNVVSLGGSQQISGGITTYLFGPRLNWRKFERFIPFGEVLIGGVHGGSELTGGSSQSAFALAAGGGVDVALTRNLAWRFAQLDYMTTSFTGSLVGATARQNNFRAATGLVLRLGTPNPAPPPNHPPVAACSVNPASVYAGSGDMVAMHVNASDPDNDPLTYSYTASGGVVEGTGPDARWNSSGVAVGTYTVTAKVDDGRGGTASCAADIKVEEKPNHPPTAALTVERSPIMPGERTGVTCTGTDPDNDPLTYSYTTTGGQIAGTGSKVQFDSTGLQPGSYTVKCTVNDGRGGTADASGNVDVQQPPPPPQATKVGDCGYTKPGSSRFDNACKRVGDDVALRLKNDPAAKLVIVGYAGPKEPRAAKLALERAELAKKYLGEKGIDASRITTRAGSASAEKGMEKENRRVDFVIVPEGATY